MSMKTRIAVFVLVALTLTGCGRVGSIEDAADARDQCHEFGGVFTSWTTDAGYAWSCDLGDTESGR